MTQPSSAHPRPNAADGLSLAPFRALRFTGDIGRRLCPPYDVISDVDREDLLAADARNAVRLVLPGSSKAERDGAADNPIYPATASLLSDWIADGTLSEVGEPALFVYEMSDDTGTTRGLIGALELRSPEDGVILPHENTMAGPVADRLALMQATEANLEAIYLVYDGGGAASEAVATVSADEPVFIAQTPDGLTHRLWSITDPVTLSTIAQDLAGRRALIADGHHRYATYLQLQAEHAGEPGPWDRGLTLLVDTTAYGPQVHPIHRVVDLPFERSVELSRQVLSVNAVPSLAEALALIDEIDGFAAVLSDGRRFEVIHSFDPEALAAGLGDVAGTALGSLDVTVLHRCLVEGAWGLNDNTETVDYAHDIPDALEAADGGTRTAVLLRPTPVTAVAEVAAAGGRMPRKSTLFTPKPASGVLLRRFADQ
ncbi:DUF1015 domain-containing protein [Jatrophihabitans telluris]|uniref:DUF1015 domain-containing protein n=1 Tax=Jatrophihabitans telluris TaxID=2038343 RepID=A0ABY4R524_9ACTN|nr:DUF1015 domain-containing protein [Jatrophihabitans telluris]UQX90111.1 DUF1015 domain-containing protein [Jatrophihabitans telluris]